MAYRDIAEQLLVNAILAADAWPPDHGGTNRASDGSEFNYAKGWNAGRQLKPAQIATIEAALDSVGADAGLCYTTTVPSGAMTSTPGYAVVHLP